MPLHSQSLVSRLGWFACLLPLWCLGCAPKPAESTAAPSKATAETTTTAPLHKVKLLLNWFPEAEHGGFYAAQVHGYFRDAGLDVEIVPGGPGVPVVQQVARKQVEFAIANADPICFGRAEQAPVVALMAPLQTSPRCIMVHEKSGIKKFEDIHDMTVAMSNTSAFSHFLSKKFSFKTKNVQIVPYPGSVATFLQKDDFAQQGYVFSEPYLAKQQGGDPHVLLVSDEGFNPYTSCLITHDDTVKQDPALARKVVQASLKGWQQYLSDPTKTNELIHSLNKEMSLDALAFGVEKLKPLVDDTVTKAQGIGHMGLERWQTLVDQLVEIGQLAPDKVKTSDLFTTEFLKPSEK